MTGHKYGFQQSFPEELIEDFGREYIESLARQYFQEHLDALGLHRVEDEQGAITLRWSDLPQTTPPPEETRLQRIWRIIRRRPALEPYVIWPIVGYTRVREAPPDADI